MKKTFLKNPNLNNEDNLSSGFINNQVKTTDVNILLNRVKFEKKSEIKKNLILTAGVLGALSVTAFITII